MGCNVNFEWNSCPYAASPRKLFQGPGSPFGGCQGWLVAFMTLHQCRGSRCSDDHTVWGPHDYHQIHQSWSKMMQPTDSEGDLCGLISGGNIPYSSENQTCPLKNAGWKMIPFLLKWPLLRGHVRFQGCHNFVPFDEPLEKKGNCFRSDPDETCLDLGLVAKYKLPNRPGIVAEYINDPFMPLLQ